MLTFYLFNIKINFNYCKRYLKTLLKYFELFEKIIYYIFYYFYFLLKFMKFQSELDFIIIKEIINNLKFFSQWRLSIKAIHDSHKILKIDNHNIMKI